MKDRLEKSRTNLLAVISETPKRIKNPKNNSSINQFESYSNETAQHILKLNVKKETNLEEISSIDLLNEIQEFLFHKKSQSKDKSVIQLIKMLDELVSLEKSSFLMSGEDESQKKNEYLINERINIAAFADFLKENKCKCEFSSKDLIELKEMNEKMLITNDQGMQTDLLRYLVKPKVTKSQYVQVEPSSKEMSSQSESQIDLNQSNTVRLSPRKFQKLILQNSVHEKTVSVDGSFNMSLKNSDSKKFTEVFVPKKYEIERKNYDLSPTAKAQLQEAFEEDHFLGYCQMHCNQKNAMFYEISNKNYDPTSYILQRESSKSNFKTCVSSVRKGIFNFVPWRANKRNKLNGNQIRKLEMNNSNFEPYYLTSNKQN